MRALPVVDGYTMDERLREFRKADPKTGIEFVPFDSPQGRQLLERFKRATAES